MQPVMSIAELHRFLENDFPQLAGSSHAMTVTALEPGRATLQLLTGTPHLRPGGTVSGPTLFALADVAAYVAILAHIGPVALAVTTNLSINFLRKADPGLVTAQATIMKLGKRLAVLEIAIEGPDGELAAHAVATYSIPPR
ncbi:PaaI family thioesterase [Aurantimonas sp. Leaf443]|uniref:PaaI family thioesterase n=1 Tax=Aurantimonas sp. Leaf443 TaxID=1736378 RepID=UPI0006FC67DC|nr:PaaI family thioesterase [Aurantimonas sp. Leaf443]KQT86324.1 hypothetical protein ASG48_07155 [Aurantimonas sp. Leaf443]